MNAKDQYIGKRVRRSHLVISPFPLSLPSAEVHLLFFTGYSHGSPFQSGKQQWLTDLLKIEKTVQREGEFKDYFFNLCSL